MLLHRMLSERGDEPLALIRNPEQEDEVRAAGAEPVVCDLEAADPGEVAAAISGADAVVFAAGGGPGSGAERKWTVDHGGAVKLIKACRQSGIGRYLMVSSIGADADADGDDTFQVYLRAKGKADEELAGSGLDAHDHPPGQPHRRARCREGRAGQGRARRDPARGRGSDSRRGAPRAGHRRQDLRSQVRRYPRRRGAALALGRRRRRRRNRLARAGRSRPPRPGAVAVERPAEGGEPLR